MKVTREAAVAAGRDRRGCADIDVVHGLTLAGRPLRTTTRFDGATASEMSLAAGIPHALSDASRRDIAELCPAVVTRESGRFSIPEMLAMESRGRSVQDTPHARGMTTPCGADYPSRIAE